MKRYELRQVKRHKKDSTAMCDERQFLDVATIINGRDPLWVQPLDTDIKAIFDPAKNELFIDGDAIRWVLFDNDRPVGRIAAFYNKNSAAKEAQPTGGCGFFECIDNQQAANVLFDAARDWLAERGMEAMDGPINFGDRLSWWGVLVDGFTMPLYGVNYNPPYYGALFEGYGFENYFNQHTYLRPVDPLIPLNPTLREKAERLHANPEYRFSGVDMKNIKKIAEDFRTVYNSGWANFEGVTPMTSEHARSMMRLIKPIVDPQVLIFAYHNDEPVGFFVNVPDLNQIIYRFKGKFGIIQKLQLLWQLKVTKSISRLTGIVFGISAPYQGKGIEAGMICQLEIYANERRKVQKEQYKTLELMWIGDFNPVMMRVAETYVNATRHKRHVTYRYLFDRSKPFTRCPRMGSTKEKRETQQ